MISLLRKMNFWRNNWRCRKTLLLIYLQLLFWTLVYQESAIYDQLSLEPIRTQINGLKWNYIIFYRKVRKSKSDTQNTPYRNIPNICSRDHASITSSCFWLFKAHPSTSLIIYSTVNHKKLQFTDTTDPPLWWRNTWMVR